MQHRHLLHFTDNAFLYFFFSPEGQCHLCFGTIQGQHILPEMLAQRLHRHVNPGALHFPSSNNLLKEEQRI